MQEQGMELYSVEKRKQLAGPFRLNLTLKLRKAYGLLQLTLKLSVGTQSKIKFRA